jgi:hypothetical protein
MKFSIPSPLPGPHNHDIFVVRFESLVYLQYSDQLFVSHLHAHCVDTITIYFYLLLLLLFIYLFKLQMGFYPVEVVLQ